MISLSIYPVEGNDMIDKTSRQFRRGIREESKEHHSLDKKQIETIVVDHLTLHPYMYKK